MHHLDTVLLEMLGIADTREHEQLGRVERSGADDNLTSCLDLNRLPALRVLNPHRALALHEDTMGESVHLELEVRSLQRGLEIRRWQSTSAYRS